MITKGNNKIKKLVKNNKNVLAVYKGHVRIWPNKESLIQYAIPDGEWKAGDIVLYSKRKGHIFAVTSDNLDRFDPKLFAPIGIVVIPQSHDVYDNGCAGVMSLKYMSCKTPDEGTFESEKIYFGWSNYSNFTTNISSKFSSINSSSISLYYRCYFNHLGKCSSAPLSSSTSYNYLLYFPGDKLDKEQYPLSKNLKYGINIDSSLSTYYWGISPYRFDIKFKSEIRWEVISGTWNSSNNVDAIDGIQYTCISPGTSGMTRIRCIFSKLTSITFSFRSDAEINYDYLIVGKIDTDLSLSIPNWTGSPFNNTNVITHTRGNQGQWLTYTFNTDTNEHFVDFVFGKDSSTDTQPDNAQVYISDIISDKYNIISEEKETLFDKYAGSLFNGKEYTEIWQNLYPNEDESWKTSAVIQNTLTIENYDPAPKTVWRYHTLGTNQGDWYMPSNSELIYILPKHSIIEDSLDKCKRYLGNKILLDNELLCSNYGFYSSANCNTMSKISLTNGKYANIYNNMIDKCLAFIQLKTKLLNIEKLNIKVNVPVGVQYVIVKLNGTVYVIEETKTIEVYKGSKVEWEVITENFTNCFNPKGIIKSIEEDYEIIPEVSVPKVNLNIIFIEGVISMIVNGIKYFEDTIIEVNLGENITWSAEIDSNYNYLITSGSFMINEFRDYDVSVSNPQSEIWYRTTDNIRTTKLSSSSFGNNVNVIDHYYDEESGYCKIICDNDITEIPNGFNAQTLKSIDLLPDTIEKIGDQFCMNCFDLEYIKFPKKLPNLISIGNSFLYFTKTGSSTKIKFTSLELPNMPNLEIIGSSFLRMYFYSNDVSITMSLTNVILGNMPKLQSIGSNFIYMELGSGNSGNMTVTINNIKMGETPNLKTIGGNFISGADNQTKWETYSVKYTNVYLSNAPLLESVGTGYFNSKVTVTNIYAKPESIDKYKSLMPTIASKIKEG